MSHKDKDAKTSAGGPAPVPAEKYDDLVALMKAELGRTLDTDPALKTKAHDYDELQTTAELKGKSEAASIWSGRIRQSANDSAWGKDVFAWAAAVTTYKVAAWVNKDPAASPADAKVLIVNSPSCGPIIADVKLSSPAKK